MEAVTNPYPCYCLPGPVRCDAPGYGCDRYVHRLCALCGHSGSSHIGGGCTALTDDGEGFPTDCGCEPFEQETQESA